MSLSLQDIIKKGFLDELATVFRDETNSDILLMSIGFPMARKPMFNHPFAFWKTICEEIQNGLIENGFEKLIQAALQKYQTNPVFNRMSGLSTPHVTTTPKTPVSSKPLKVFLCHSSADKPAVRTVYLQLKNDGFTPWLDEEDLLPGQNWNLEIKKAVKNTDVVIIFLTTDSINKKGYVQKEIKMTLDVADEQPEGSIFLIPLKLEPCELPDRLSHCQWLDYFGDINKAYEKLKRALIARRNEL
jgi:hypothetical protein